jgi:monothiol glutaredoxin
MQTVSRPTFQQLMPYSSAPSGDSNVNEGTSTTRVAADPDTHQDFQPTSKGSGMSLHDIVAQVYTCVHELSEHFDSST